MSDAPRPRMDLDQTTITPSIDFPPHAGDGADETPFLGGAAVESYRVDGDRIERAIRGRDGALTVSSIPLPPVIDGVEETLADTHERTWLRLIDRPIPPQTGLDPLRVVDLFSGCGGMTLGVQEAARGLGRGADAVLAADLHRDSLDIYADNFSPAFAADSPIEAYLDGDLGDPFTESERVLAHFRGHIDICCGGPPCKGHSNLNNHTRYSDGKNALFAKMARFAEVVRPTHIIIENVFGIHFDEKGVFEQTRAVLRGLGYIAEPVVLASERYGVAQTRHRVFLVASLRPEAMDAWAAEDGAESELSRRYGVGERTFEWACGDLADAEQGPGFGDYASFADVTRRRIDYLHDEGLYELPDSERPPCHRDKKHTYPSVYGRIHADRPSPTITTGFVTMGQGRFVHPTRRSTLTAHEAARIQYFPDFFDFGTRSRRAYRDAIGNAVPSRLTYMLALELLR